MKYIRSTIVLLALATLKNEAQGLGLMES